MTAVLRKGQLTYLNRLQSVCLLFNHSGAEVLQEIVSVQPDCAKAAGGGDPSDMQQLSDSRCSPRKHYGSIQFNIKL